MFCLYKLIFFSLLSNFWVSAIEKTFINRAIPPLPLSSSSFHKIVNIAFTF